MADDYDVLTYQDDAVPSPPHSEDERDGDGLVDDEDRAEFGFRRLPAPPSDVTALQQAWVGEVCAPELLVFKEGIINKMLTHLQDLQSHVDEYK
jgi:hypothetical protein